MWSHLKQKVRTETGTISGRELFKGNSWNRTEPKKNNTGNSCWWDPVPVAGTGDCLFLPFCHSWTLLRGLGGGKTIGAETGREAHALMIDLFSGLTEKMGSRRTDCQLRPCSAWSKIDDPLSPGWEMVELRAEERIKNMLQVVLVICACLDACLGAKKTRSILFAGSCCCCCCCCRIMMMTWISKQIGLSVKSNSIGRLEAELKASERKIYCVYSAFASFVESGY